MHLESLLHDLTLIFGVALVVVLGLGRIGLPPIAGFLLAGITIGPGGFGLVDDVHQVEVLAELGVALLLFTIGLEFSLARLQRIARYVTIGGGMQVLFTVAAATAITVLYGGRWQVGVFFGFLAALSSTAIVLRALADRNETRAPHGRFVVAVLIFQDLCIVPMMLALPLLAGQAGGPADIAWTLGKAVAVVVGVLVLARRVVPFVLHHVAATRRRELFLLSVLLIAIAVASATSAMGLSLALGAFLAGVVVADTDFVHQASSDVAPFRDALASLFFVSIGMLLDPAVIGDAPLTVLGLCVVLLVGKALLATLAGLGMRFPPRVAVVAGVSLAQVGEFSFVLLQEGQDLGIVAPDVGRMFVAASVLTMIVTPLMVAASPRIGAAGATLLRPLEHLLADTPEEDDPATTEVKHGHVIVAGYGLGGRVLVAALESARVPYITIELEPEAVRAERSTGRDVRYGDITSAEVLAHVAQAGTAKVLVLLLSDAEATRRCVAVARQHFPRLHVIARTQRHTEHPPSNDPNVEVVTEDYETALEIVERVLHRLGSAMAGAVNTTRHTRDAAGERMLDLGTVVGAMAMDGVVLTLTDWAADRTIAETGLRAVGGALVVAVSRGETTITTPAPDLRLDAGDVLFLFGTRPQLDRSRAHLTRGP